MTTDTTKPTDIVLSPENSQAIAMAERKPRSISTFIKECVTLVTMDEETAADCLYALPRKEKDEKTGRVMQKIIEGPSARLAEIINYNWGNCRAEGRITDDRGEFVTAQGTWIDLEKNSGVRTETRRRITTKRGDRYSADMIMQTGNAAISIARRNAILAGIPKVFWSKIYEAARHVVKGDARTLASRRSDALDYMQKIGVTADMVLAALGVESVEEIDLDKLATLRAMATAIKEGETTIEEAFPKAAEGSGEQPTNGKAAEGAGKKAEGSVTEKAKQALKKDTPPAPSMPTAFEITGLTKLIDKAGVPESAILQRYAVTKLDELTGVQYEAAMRFCAGVLAGENVPA
jgi:hypothetical protein